MNKDFVLQSTYCNYNYGSTLQCYATQKFLEEKGISCYLIQEKKTFFIRVISGIKRRINYFLLCRKYPLVKEEQKKTIASNKKSSKSINAKSVEFMTRFISEEINTICCSYFKLKRLSRYEKCKMCIAGSDQIWNASKVLINPIYFLNFSPNNKRIAFAPSFSNTEISNYNIKYFKKNLSKFKKLSVRELSGKKIISDLLQKDSTLIMDPIFLLSYSNWKSLEKKSLIENFPKKFVFVFFLDEPNEAAIKTIMNYKKKGYEVWTIGYDHFCYNKFGTNVHDGGPIEFIEMIDKADIIVTDSFHAMAFSTLFHKAFLVFKRNYIGNDQSDRIISFLNEAGLSILYEPITDIKFEEISFAKFEKIRSRNLKTVFQYLELD